MGERLTIQPGKVDKRGMGQARKMVIQAVCARAEEMGKIMPRDITGSMKGKKGHDNCNDLYARQGNDQTYLARKIMTDSPARARAIQSVL